MDRMTLTLDIQANDIGAKRVNVRSSLLAANLIATLQDKFNLDGTFELRPADAREALPPDSPLDQAGVSDGMVLECVRVLLATGTLDRIERGVREPFSKPFQRAYLHEARSLTEYDLAWQPAIIGRRDHRNPANNRLLAADLEEIEELPTVSRHHACITERDGSFFVESVHARNPTYLDGTRLRQGMQYALPAGSILQVGRVWLTFHLIT